MNIARALAAFLVSISQRNVYEGLNAAVNAHAIECGTVASLLRLDIEILGKTLLDLKNRGLIQDGSYGQIYIIDLERLADGAGILS